MPRSVLMGAAQPAVAMPRTPARMNVRFPLRGKGQLQPRNTSPVGVTEDFGTQLLLANPSPTLRYGRNERPSPRRGGRDNGDSARGTRAISFPGKALYQYAN